jgi:hypothetical protein
MKTRVKAQYWITLLVVYVIFVLSIYTSEVSLPSKLFNLGLLTAFLGLLLIAPEALEDA